MKKIKYTLIAIALAAGFIGLNNWARGNQITVEAVSGPVKSSYTPRLVENVEVKNYNVVQKSVQLYEQQPRRVLTVGENITETLVALGVEDNIAAAVSYGNAFYKPEPQYADGYSKINFSRWGIPNVETVLAVAPDLIISGQSLFTEKGLRSTAFWHERGINTFLPLNANAPASREHRESLENEYEFILGLGKIFDREKEAEQIVSSSKNTVQQVQSKIKNQPKPKVLIIEQLGKSIVAYDNTKLAGDICMQLGATVPASPFGTVGLEYLLEENPDVLLVVQSGGDPEQSAQYFRTLPALRTMKCVENNRVYGIALNYTYNSAIKTQAGVEKIAKALYPDLF